MASVASEAPRRTAPQQMQTARSTLLIDRVMTLCITVGGIAVNVAVLGIFVFIMWQILPLFQGAKVQAHTQVPLPAQPYALLAVDEWSELPILVTTAGTLLAVDLTDKGRVQELDVRFDPAKDIVAIAYRQQQQQLVVASSVGAFALVDFQYKMTHKND